MTPAEPWGTGAGATACGARLRNEDAFCAQAPVFIVADGMGGHVGGAAAAAAVVEAFKSLLHGRTVGPDEVSNAVALAHVGVLEVARQVGDNSGSTLTGVVAVEHAGQPWWMVINVGDSRVYSLFNGQLEQVTVDHSHVQQLVDDGAITEEDALNHPERNIITRAVGDGVPDFDAWLVPARPSERFIVASDGLNRSISDERIATIAAQGSIDDAATALVEAALAADASDNVTVVVVEAPGIVTPQDADPSPWRTWPAADDTEDDTTLGRRLKVLV